MSESLRAALDEASAEIIRLRKDNEKLSLASKIAEDRWQAFREVVQHLDRLSKELIKNYPEEVGGGVLALALSSDGIIKRAEKVAGEHVTKRSFNWWCPRCLGSGYAHSEQELSACHECKGSGWRKENE